jgi:hypothetical protein
MLLILTLLLAAAGCSRQEEAKTEHPAATEKQRARVVVPDNVKGQWRAVKIAVRDKENNTEDIYTVNIGYEFVVAGSQLRLKVENFLPAFIMDGTKMTSASNETRNPAVQIIVTEGGAEIFEGWLFSLYPGTHAFEHQRYNFSLVDFIPAGKKG